MSTIRHDWQRAQAQAICEQPLMELLFEAQTVHRQHFDPNAVQISQLCNIKTGACPEDCSYCSQSGHHNTDLKKAPLMDVDSVIAEAKAAKASGATRFCMGAAWRSPPAKDMPKVVAMIKAVNALGLESCATLGMLDDEQAQALKAAGLDYYNHNLDTSPEYYQTVATTRTYQDRLDTVERVRQAGIHVCSGGILGMGETRDDRIGLLMVLANLPEHPGSVPINQLARIPGTPLADKPKLDELEFVRTVALARIMMPKAMVRLSAGRESMSFATQALCFFAGANSIHLGDKLLTVKNNKVSDDMQMFASLGMQAMPVQA